MYPNLNCPTRFVRVVLPAVAAAFFLQGNLPAQHVHFDTRYQTNGSSSRWQAPLPSVHAQPSPWHGAQSFPSGFHQLNPQAQAVMQVAPPISQPIQNHGMVQPTMTGVEYPMQIPMQVASPLSQPMHEIPMASNFPAFPMESSFPAIPMESQLPAIPMELPMDTSVAATDIPLAPIVGTETGAPVPSVQGIPEGYDPTYPIEYPGEDFKGYYPTEGGVIAPPSDTSEMASSESSTDTSPVPSSTNGSSNRQSSTEPQAPAIPSVVIQDTNAGVVMPETADAVNPSTQQSVDNGSMSKANPEAPATADNNRRSDKMSAKESAMEKAEGDAEAKMIKKLKQQMRAAELRAREAEEKAMAIARQSTSDQKKVDQLKSELAKSNKNLNHMKSQATMAKQQLEQLKMARKEAAAEMKKEKAAAMKKKKAAAEEKAQKEKAMKDKAMAESAIELEPAAEPEKMKDARKESKQSTKAKASNEKTLSEKIAALETARDKQLAAASVRLKTDFNDKIDEKLDAGKTDQHPEVLTLKDALKKRLNQSDKNIRGRYKRQINKLRKEAAARSRS